MQRPAVDVRPAVFDRNGMGRTDIAAHAAADAQRPLQARPRPQRKRRRLPEQAAEGAAPRAEIRPRPMLDDPEIRAGKGRSIPGNTELRRIERRQAPLGSRTQRRHIFRLQPDERGAQQVNAVRVRPGQQRAERARRSGPSGPFPSMATTASTR